MAEENKVNPILHAVGITAMMLSICLFSFTLYIIPHIVFGISYDVPEFIIIVTYWYSTVQQLQGFQLGATIVLPYVLSASILAFIAKRLTHRIEGQQNMDIRKLQNMSFMQLVRPAMYEIVLISTVLVSLFFAIFVIVIKFD